MYASSRRWRRAVDEELAGERTLGPHISLQPLPPRGPELNSQETIRQFTRQNWLSNRIFKSFDDIVAHCCHAQNTLMDQPWKIMSLAQRDPSTSGTHCDDTLPPWH
jgi:hypothetical protein